MDKNDKPLDNPEFLVENEPHKNELTKEEKDGRINDDKLTEKDSQNLYESLEKHAEILPRYYLSKPIRNISFKERKIKKKKRRMTNASRKKNRKR